MLDKIGRRRFVLSGCLARFYQLLNSCLGRCTCGKGFVPPTVYAKPGEQTALVNFPDPEVQYCADLVRKEVNPKVLPARFALGKHVMTYSFWYKVDDQPEDKTNCFVNFTVARKFLCYVHAVKESCMTLILY